MKAIVIVLLLSSILAAVGCDSMSNARFTNEARKARGMIVILPGIEGPGPANANIRRGLVAAGLDMAIPIHAWGVPVPGAGLLINQVNFLGNRMAGASLARFIADYQDRYPGKPVYIIGHSGGGGIAVFAAEAMPDGKKLDRVILLSASISAGYNLTKALANCRGGIVNFYNPDDAALLGVGTTIMGNVDGGHGPGAGMNGFSKSFPALVQQRILGGGDPHFAATSVGFVSSTVAPWVGGGGLTGAPGPHRPALAHLDQDR
jgi:pimeloyl-ACP methyl ester carboxylesterase